MKREEFLRQLAAALVSLSDAERACVIDYYREMICDGVENGKDEEELIAGFGNPREIAAQILKESREGFQEHEVPAESPQAGSAGAARAAPEESVYPARGAVHTVVVAAQNTAVELRPVQGGPVTVRFTPGTNDHVEVYEQGGVFSFRQTMTFSVFHWRDLFSRPRRICVDIPASFAGEIRASTGNARLRAAGLGSLRAMTLSTSNGHLSAEGFRCENLRARTSNGALELRGMRGGACTAQTSNGRATAEGCVFRDALSLRSSNGAVCAQDVESDHIEFTTSNGSVSAVIRGDMREYAVRSRTSNASNTLPPELVYPGQKKSLDVRTSNGRIDVRFAPAQA